MTSSKDNVGTTVCCLLCKGWIRNGVKDGNSERFRRHMENDHALIFNLDFMLAASLMEKDQVDSIANSISIKASKDKLLMEKNETKSLEDTLQEKSVTDEGTNGYSDMQDASSIVEKYKSEVTSEPNDEVFDSSKSLINVNESLGKLKSHVCTLCGKGSSSKQLFKNHVQKKHVDQELTDEFIDSCRVMGEVRGKSKDFNCSFTGCPKSYSNKISIRAHEIKDHGAEKKRGRPNSTSDAKLESNAPENDKVEEFDMNEFDRELKVREEENRKRAEELANLFKEAEAPENFSDSEKREVETEGESDMEVAPSDETANVSSAKTLVNLSNSKYFQKNPNIISNARGKSLKLFTEEAAGLPEGWKVRSIERESKEGAKPIIVKHYLSPDQRVLKTVLGVLEFLRCEGKLDANQLMDLRSVLKVSDRKVKELY